MREQGRKALLGALAAAAILGLAPVLDGSGAPTAPDSHARTPAPGATDTPSAERELRAAEAGALGPAHAAEHAQVRARARDAAASGASASAAVDAPAAAAVSTDPAQVGRWAPKFSIPGVAVHSVMLRTGKILYFTGTTSGRAFLLDPVTQTTRAVYPPRVPGLEDEPANIFCAGQSFLDDGTVVVMGGTIDRREGMKTIFTFDPITETWTRRADMRHGRWYPTQVLLADGRTVVMDGLDETGEPNVNQQIESYTPNLDFVTLLSVRGQQDQPPTGGLYPHLFQMPSGRVLVAGPEPTDSWFFRLSGIGALSWEDTPNPLRHTWGTGVMLPGGPGGSTRVELIGGVDRASLPDSGTSTPLPTVQTFDEANPQAGWTDAPSLNHGRAHHNTVLLPDRSMVTVGGGYGILNGNRRSGDSAVHRNIEIWDEATGAWTLGPAQDELRTYHSTALLLPDGRVLSAGDDGYGGTSNDTAEIYEPPYLFRGARPTIQAAPGAVGYGDTFAVDAAGGATKAVLVAPGAVTHANDMSQRYVPLETTSGAGGTLTVEAPPSPALAPPTYYMLFVLNDAGVPSVARFVRLELGPGDVPPETLITSGPPALTQSTTATFAFGSTRPGASFRCSRDGGPTASCASPWTLSTLSEGPHSFAVAAVDSAGRVDATPAEWAWTVEPAPPDATAPQTTIESGPPVATAATEATFEFVSSESASTFECRTGGGAWGPCTSPTSYEALAAGPHSFEVRATDAASNTDQSPATWTWDVRQEGPSTPAPIAAIEPDGGGSGSATALADSTPPAVEIRSASRLVMKQRRVVIEVSCTSEPCNAVARGRVLIAGAARTFKLLPAVAQIARGARARMELRFTKATSRTVRRALRRRADLRAKVVLTATDSTGNATTSRRTTRLKP